MEYHVPLVILKNTQEENVYMILLKYDVILDKVISIYKQLGTIYDIEDTNKKLTRAEYCFLIEQIGGILISKFTLQELLKTIEVIINFYNIKNNLPRRIQQWSNNQSCVKCKCIYILWSQSLNSCYISMGIMSIDICQYYSDFHIIDTFEDNKEVSEKLTELFHLKKFTKDELYKKIYAFRILFNDICI